MCGRTSLAVAIDVMIGRFNAKPAEGINIPQRYNLAPRDDLVVIQNDAPEEFDLLQWGFLPHWADSPDATPRPINARSETLAQKPMFRDAFQQRRCLILADGFYEWQGQRGSKQPYRFERVDQEPYAYAGLWETWSGNGETLSTCTILTCDANDVVSKVHDRMPVMLTQEAEATWIGNSDPTDLQSVLQPYPDEKLRAYPISKRVNDPSYDSPDVLEEIDIGEQSGLEDFGA